MKLAITGGAGFLGLHLCEGMKDRFEEILVLDIAPVDLKEYPAKVRYQRVDVRDKVSLTQALKGMDCVIHGAAALPLWKKKDIYDINVEGTRNVLNAALENHVSRVVFISSTAVYGVPKVHPLLEDFHDVDFTPSVFKDTVVFVPEVAFHNFLGLIDRFKKSQDRFGETRGCIFGLGIGRGQTAGPGSSPAYFSSGRFPDNNYCQD